MSGEGGAMTGGGGQWAKNGDIFSAALPSFPTLSSSLDRVYSCSCAGEMIFCLTWPQLYLKKAKIQYYLFLKIYYTFPMAQVCPLFICCLFFFFFSSHKCYVMDLPVIFLGNFSITQCTLRSEKFLPQQFLPWCVFL